MTSSWSRAKACSNSKLAAARRGCVVGRRAAQPAQVYERGPQTFTAGDELNEMSPAASMGTWSEFADTSRVDEIGDIAQHHSPYVGPPCSEIVSAKPTDPNRR